jgi:hypothetical protein
VAQEREGIIVFDHLTYYFKKGTVPFRTLSDLPEAEAIQLMKAQYTDDPVGGRFRDPEVHLRDRRLTEDWLLEAFILKGGEPIERHPIYFVLGFYQEFEAVREQYQLNLVKVPLSTISEKQISFTFFDSMYSYRLGRDKTPEYYQERFHGKVFTKAEILSIVMEKQESGETWWWGRIPKDYFPMIEAQVWDRKPLGNAVGLHLDPIRGT